MIPQKNEHWTVEYGTEAKTRIIVKVLEEPKTNEIVKNWRFLDLKCDRLGETILVKCNCFVDKWG